MSYRQNRKWADHYLPQIRTILKGNAEHIVDVEIAPGDVDRQNATDVILRVSGGDIAVRLRRASCRFRDLTIRSTVRGAQETELHKIKAGFGDWYLYCWMSTKAQINEWILVDLHALRASGLLNSQKEIRNHDGKTKFIAIEQDELKAHGCIVSKKIGQRANGN